MNWDTYHTIEIKEKYVFRYLTLEKLVDFLETGELFLSRLDKFEDNLENISPYEIYELKMRSGLIEKPQNANPNIPEHHWDKLISDSRNSLIQLQENLKMQQKYRFVSCWILSDVESFAMWDIYGKSGFAIRFEREYFQELIKISIPNQTGITKKIDLLVAGKVTYQNFDEIIFKEEESKLRFSVYRKHQSFEHEREYRIVAFMNEILDVSGLRYKLPSLKDIRFDIIANPRLDTFQFDKYKEIISKFTTTQKLTESQLKIWLEFRGNDYYKSS